MYFGFRDARLMFGHPFSACGTAKRECNNPKQCCLTKAQVIAKVTSSGLPRTVMEQTSVSQYAPPKNKDKGAAWASSQDLLLRAGSHRIKLNHCCSWLCFGSTLEGPHL